MLDDKPITIILLLLVVLGAAYIVLKNLGGLIGLIGHSITSLPAAERDLLREHSPYFRALDEHRKKEFAKRVKEVLFEKEWIGRGITVDREMRVRIAAALVQLTFGLERLLLLHFGRIEVHPKEYRDRTTGRMHQGGVRPATGTITLSWKHFQHGYADPHDARNVALHELAHALWLENRIENGEDDFFEYDELVKWRKLATEEIQRIRSGHPSFFRSYAATDQAEFFAVAVEYFFERPRDFKREMPEAYSVMRAILKQDPASLEEQAA